MKVKAFVAASNQSKKLEHLVVPTCVASQEFTYMMTYSPIQSSVALLSEVNDRKGLLERSNFFFYCHSSFL